MDSHAGCASKSRMRLLSDTASQSGVCVAPCSIDSGVAAFSDPRRRTNQFYPTHSHNSRPSNKTPSRDLHTLHRHRRKLYKPAENEPDFGPYRFAAYYPFCDYSPESWRYESVRKSVRACALSISITPIRCLLNISKRRTAGQASHRVVMRETHLQQSAYLQALAQRAGCRDFNEMWDHLFEANFQSRSTESFMREVATYCFFATPRSERQEVARKRMA